MNSKQLNIMNNLEQSYKKFLKYYQNSLERNFKIIKEEKLKCLIYK